MTFTSIRLMYQKIIENDTHYPCNGCKYCDNLNSLGNYLSSGYKGTFPEDKLEYFDIYRLMNIAEKFGYREHY